MYQRVECESCGKMNLSNVVTCICGSKKGEVLISQIKCHVAGCFEKPIERFGEKIWGCLKHSDDIFLKLHPGSLSSEIIMNSRKMLNENKDV